jgi:hypothetical protein
MANPDDRDGFGIIVTYLIKVRLFLGALAGELVGELPIIMMHPKVFDKIFHLNFVKSMNTIIISLIQPNPKKLPRMDSVAFETFGSNSVDDAGQDLDRMKLDNVDE